MKWRAVFLGILLATVPLAHAATPEVRGAADLRAARERSLAVPGFRLGDLSYEGPACRGAKSPEELLQSLSTSRSWKPGFSDAPFRNRFASEKELAEAGSLEEFLPGIRREPGKVTLPFLKMTVYFSEADEEPGIDRFIPLQWVDLDGDGICDLVATGYSGSGITGHTWIYIFLQTRSGFRLVDFTPLDDTRTGLGYQPAALMPVWIKGEARPFLVLRQELMLLGAGYVTALPRSNLAELAAAGPYGNRSAIRWEPATQDWTVYTSGMLVPEPAGDLIAKFVAENPPPDRGRRYCETFKFPCKEPH